MFAGKTLLITGGTGLFGNAVLKRFLHTDTMEIRGGPLAEAIKKIMSDKALRESIVNKGHDVAMWNHEGATVRERLRRDLLGIVRGCQLAEQS